MGPEKLPLRVPRTEEDIALRLLLCASVGAFSKVIAPKTGRPLTPRMIGLALLACGRVIGSEAQATVAVRRLLKGARIVGPGGVTALTDLALNALGASGAAAEVGRGRLTTTHHRADVAGPLRRSLPPDNTRAGRRRRRGHEAKGGGWDPCGVCLACKTSNGKACEKTRGGG